LAVRAEATKIAMSWSASSTKGSIMPRGSQSERSTTLSQQPIGDVVAFAAPGIARPLVLVFCSLFRSSFHTHSSTPAGRMWLTNDRHKSSNVERN
jgi:hypothetical protein